MCARVFYKVLRPPCLLVLLFISLGFIIYIMPSKYYKPVLLQISETRERKYQAVSDDSSVPPPFGESFDLYKRPEDKTLQEKILNEASKLNLPQVESIIKNLNAKGRPQFLQNASCARFPTIFDVKYSNTYWQTFETPTWIVHTMGAFLDTRKISKDTPCVRIVGMIQRLGPDVKGYCQIWFSDEKEPIIAQISHYCIWPPWVKYKRGEVQPYILTCKLPASHKKKVPMSVSIVDKPCSNSSINLKVEYDKPKTKEGFAVCVKGMDFPDDDMSIRMVEWIELQHLLGASKVFIYELAVTPKTKKVLDYYEEIGSVEVIPTTLPPMFPNEPYTRHEYLKKMVAIKHQTEIVPYNDCFYRNMYKYKYIAVVDVDEVLMPKKYPDWNEMMLALEAKSLNASKSGHTDFVFHNTYFFFNPKDADYAHYEDIPKEYTMLQHVRRTFFNNTGKTEYIKCFHSTERVLSLHNHFPRSCINGCKHFYVEEIDGQMQHYKATCFSKKNCIPKFKTQSVLDTSIWKYKDELIQRVNQVVNLLGLK